MLTIDESDKYTYPCTIDENEFVDIRNFQEPLYERAMADARHEANHREVSWRNLGASFEVAHAFGTSVDLTFRGVDHYTSEHTVYKPDLPAPTKNPSQLGPHLQLLQSNGLDVELRYDNGGGVDAITNIAGPSEIAREALRTLNSSLLVEEDNEVSDEDDEYKVYDYSSTIPQTFSILLRCLEDAGCNAMGFRYETNWSTNQGGVFVELFSERPIDDVKVHFSALVLSELQDRVADLKNRGFDVSSVDRPLSDFARVLNESHSNDKLDKVAQKAKELSERIQ